MCDCFGSRTFYLRGVTDVPLREYIEELKKAYSREKSWTHCYLAFREAHENRHADAETIDHLALHLSTFLSSWGMYRGSSFLFKYTDYKVHVPVVKIILKCEFDPLWKTQYAPEDTALLWDLATEIKEYYQHIRKEIGHPGTATHTLLTKILLGTIGCIPAYDEKICSILRDLGKSASFNRNSLKEMLSLYQNNKEEVDQWRSAMEKAEEIPQYPYMRALDAYLWHRH